MTRPENHRGRGRLCEAQHQQTDDTTHHVHHKNLRLFDRCSGNRATYLSARALDVAEDAGSYTVKASLPGIKPEEVEITLDKNVLTIKGASKDESEKTEGTYHLRERRTGSFSRSVSLPANIDSEKIEAVNENGVLTLRVPKAEVAKPKKIAVVAK